MTQSVANIQLRYMPQLDGLRAISVALVIIHHLLLPTWFGGWVGIDLFFVLSGYLITSLLLVEIRDTGTIHLRVFYLRRILRLYPPLITAVVILIPVGLFAWHSLEAYLASSAVALTYSANIIATVTGKGVGPWTHTWTLALEEQFYLAWPAVLLLLTRMRIKRGAIVGAVSVLAAASMLGSAVMYKHDSASNFDPLFHLGPLMAGCLLALTSGWVESAKSRIVGVGGVTITALGVVLASFEGIAGYGEVVAIVGSGVLVAHLAASRPDGIFAARPMVSVGKVSYEMYLWHYPLIILVGARIGDPMLVATIAILATIAASYLSHHFVSRPLNKRFKGRLASFRRQPWGIDPEAVPGRVAGHGSSVGQDVIM